MIEISGLYRGGFSKDPSKIGALDFRIEDEVLGKKIAHLNYLRNEEFGTYFNAYGHVINPENFTMDIPTFAESILGEWGTFTEFTSSVEHLVDENDVQTQMAFEIFKACDTYYEYAPLTKRYRFDRAPVVVAHSPKFEEVGFLPQRFISKMKCRKSERSGGNLPLKYEWGRSLPESLRTYLLCKEPHPIILVPQNNWVEGDRYNTCGEWEYYDEKRPATSDLFYVTKLIEERFR